MATSTTNLGLIKPAGSDKIRIAQINQNSDTLDAAIGPVGATSLQTQMNNVQDALAIIANGDTHPAITAGQFVYVKNNTHSVAEGLHVATANISANGQITTSNVSADASGGLNALNANTVKTTDRVVIDRNTSSSLADCDNVTELGMYRIISSTANRPSNISYGILQHFMSNDYIAQMAISTGGIMAVRGKTGGSWTEWKTVTTT